MALYRHRASVGWALAVSSRLAVAEHKNLLTVFAGLWVVGNRHTMMRVGMRMVEGRWRPLMLEEGRKPAISKKLSVYITSKIRKPHPTLSTLKQQQ